MASPPKASSLGVKSLRAQFEKNSRGKALTPEQFSREQRETAEKQAAAILLARKKAAAFNLALRQLELQKGVEGTKQTPAQQEKREKLRSEARRLSHVLRDLDAGEIAERPAAMAQERRATHVLLESMAEELEQEMKREELNAIKEEEDARERYQQASADAKKDKEEREKLEKERKEKEREAAVQAAEAEMAAKLKILEDEYRAETERKAKYVKETQERDRQILTSYLQENYPEKVGDVESMLLQFAGNLDVLFEELGKDQKFDETPDTPEKKKSVTSRRSGALSDGDETVVHPYNDNETVAPGKRNDKAFLKQGIDLRHVIYSFYSIYAASKLQDIDDILRHFENRESDLFRTLEVKYDVTFATDGTCVPNNSDKTGEPFMEAATSSQQAQSKFAVDMSSRITKPKPAPETINNLLNSGSAMM